MLLLTYKATRRGNTMNEDTYSQYTNTNDEEENRMWKHYIGGQHLQKTEETP